LIFEKLTKLVTPGPHFVERQPTLREISLEAWVFYLLAVVRVIQLQNGESQEIREYGPLLMPSFTLFLIIVLVVY